MRLLVTGATGFIGRHLTRHLLGHGHEVTVLLREQYSQSQNFPEALTGFRPQLQTVFADLRHAGLTARAVAEAEPEIVFHLAAAGVTDPFLPEETALRHNVTGTINLLNACFNRQRVKRLIVARTPGESSGLNVYTVSKAAAWAFCQMYAQTRGWPILGATIFQCYGPGQAAHLLIPAAITAAKSGADLPITSGDQERDWIHVGDVAAGLEAFLAADLTLGESLDLGSGRATAVGEVVELIYRLVGKGGRPLRGALENRPGEELRQIADAERTQAHLGWQATTDLETGLRALISHVS